MTSPISYPSGRGAGFSAPTIVAGKRRAPGSLPRRGILCVFAVVIAGRMGFPAGAMGDDPASSPAPAPWRMFVVGRVVDEKGRPVAGAVVGVHATVLPNEMRPDLSSAWPGPIGEGRADASGRFRIDLPRTSSAHHENLTAVALAEGHGIGWVALDPDDEQPSAQITLGAEQVVRGRLFDLQGQPVADAAVSVHAIQRADAAPRASLLSRFEGVRRWPRELAGRPDWPRPATTDADGRFIIRGLGRGQKVTLVVQHPRSALQTIEVETDGESGEKLVAAGLLPAQFVNVRVTAADTGKPLAHAPLVILASRGGTGRFDEAETDADGRARISSWPADRWLTIDAYPPEGQPYLIARASLTWSRSLVEQSVDIALPRGVEIRGKVTEAGSGQPVAGAKVHFVPQFDPQPAAHPRPVRFTGPDGSFQVPVPARPGYLEVGSPDPDHVLESFDSGMRVEGQPGGNWEYAHARIALDPKPGDWVREINPVVRRGKTVRGTVVDPSGAPARDAWFISRVVLDTRRLGSHAWTGRDHGRAHDGRFAIHGLEDDVEVPVYFLDPKRKLGGVVKVSGRSAAGPVTVRLEPCGTALARLVDPAGQPVVQPVRSLSVNLVVTPGPPRGSRPRPGAPVVADEAALPIVDPVNYPADSAPDAGGRIRLPALIPGATYRIVDRTEANRGPEGPPIRKEFTVAPGEIVELGDILVAKPAR